MSSLPALPYLAPWYRLVPGPGKLVLEYAQRIVCLEGAAAGTLVPALLPLLDGMRTVAEIVRILGEPARPAVEKALVQLEAHGLLVDGPPVDRDEPRPVAETAHLLAALRPGGSSPAERVVSLRGLSVGVAGDGPAGVEAARLLRASGADVRRTDGPSAGAGLTVCAPSPAQLADLHGWNARALAEGAPWLQILPHDGRYAAVGPLYLPGDTCCYECFRLRRLANIGAAEELALLENAGGRSPSAPALDAAVGAIAAQLALGWLVDGDHYAPAAFHALELVPTISLTVHHVHRVPRCSVCSGLADVSPPLPWHKETAVAAGL